MTTLTAPSAAAPEHELDVPSSANAPVQGGSSPRAEKIANTTVLALLFAAPALICLHFAVANDLDIWWHLSTGQWILQHHAVPRVDLFSASMAGKPWQAYSWLFELIVTKLFLRLGLVGIATYTSAMVLAITVALYHMIRRLQADFSLAVLLTFVVGYSIGRLYMPRPWMFTILLFILELDILMHVRRSGRVRELFWLPVIFALWANVHIEYVDGLLVLGLAFVEAILARWWSAAETRVRPSWMGGALLASFLATFANPYGWRIYSVVYDYSSRLATPGGALNKVSELQAIPFRNVSDFTILLLALISAAALAWHRKFVVFEVSLLLFAAVVSFRSQRDIWVMAVAAGLILASRIVSSPKAAIRMPRFATALAVSVAAIAVLAGFPLMRVNNSLLQAQVVSSLPVKAVEAIQAKGFAGPVFDDYNWGGYLIWALHMPVSMDGRASFYGDKRIDRSIATWAAEPDWASDADLKSSNLVVGPTRASLIQLLRTDSHFQLVYEDNIATVFVARK